MAGVAEIGDGGAEGVPVFSMVPEYNIAPMVVLALETVTTQGSVAILIDDVCDTRAGDAVRSHAERLPRELLALLGTHGSRSLADVDLFAVVAGPGSFTGIRVGMAVVQGLALVTGRPVTPIPTLEAMAEGWRMGQRTALGARHSALDSEGAFEPRSLGTSEPLALVSCLDGQRGEVFFAAWSVDLNMPIALSPRILEPGVGTPLDLVHRLEQQPVDRPMVIVGAGLDRHAARLAAIGAPIVPVPMTLAEVAARLAARDRDRAISPHALQPSYIRRPDAELARERAGLAPR